MNKKIRVLIVDDSLTMRQFLTHIIDTSMDMQVVGVASDGHQAVQKAHTLRPDVIVMDIVMPEMDGLDATRDIMQTVPTPIVMITSSLDQQETDIAFRALRLGALSVLQKPFGPKHPDYVAQTTAFLGTVRAMAGVKVIHHRQHTSITKRGTKLPKILEKGEPAIIAIAVSTGGPAALSSIFRALPDDFCLPIAIVQHMSADFVPSLVDWISTVTSLPISLAQQNEQPQPGHIYFAPGDAHLSLSGTYNFELDYATRNARYTPSGDILLESVASSYGSRAIGIILTGMGDDGARGLKAMYQAGAYTIAQDEATSVVYGMPQAAYSMGATQTVLSIEMIASELISLNERIKRRTENVESTNCTTY